MMTTILTTTIVIGIPHFNDDLKSLYMNMRSNSEGSNCCQSGKRRLKCLLFLFIPYYPYI
jgi:hypothetical protein